jgi:putative ABC transport system substrate-binding protein
MLRFAIGVGVSAVAAPLWAQAPATNTRRVAVLAPSTRAKEEVILEPFFDEMRQLGWIEGQTIAYDCAYADDRHQDLTRFAAELVARKPELIYAPPMLAALAAKQATRTIPIVFGTGTDPVGNGLVASLAHPGGNVTGVVALLESLTPKRLELLREILPGAKRVGLLSDPSEPLSTANGTSLALAATALGLTIVVAEASSPAEFDAAVAKLFGQGADAIFVISTIAFNIRPRLIELANQRRLPVVGASARVAEDGALFAYGASLADQLRRSARLVDKVLRGAKPADLAVAQSTKFELVINLNTAKTLGITIPQSVLLRADEKIE